MRAATAAGSPGAPFRYGLPLPVCRRLVWHRTGSCAPTAWPTTRLRPLDDQFVIVVGNLFGFTSSLRLSSNRVHTSSNGRVARGTVEEPKV